MSVQDYQKLLTRDLYDKFREALATGKWKDGNKLTEQQKKVCIEAIIVYEHKNVAAEHRTGYIAPKPSSCGSSSPDHEDTVKWRS